MSGGFNHGGVPGQINSNEVLDLANPNNTCQDLTPLPEIWDEAVSGLLAGNIPLMCGGYPGGNNSRTSDCIVIGNPEMSEELDLSMSIARGVAGIVSLV